MGSPRWLPPGPPFDVPHRLAMGLDALGPGEPWLEPDADRPADLAEKRRLLAARRAQVLVETPASRPAQTELLALLRQYLAQHHPELPEEPGPGPDAPPLEQAALLVQEDLCLMQADPDGVWRLGAAAVCFPSRWDLPSKLGRSLTGIHDPVPGYRAALEAPADRFFARLRGERIYGRGNWQLIDDPALFQPGGAGRTEPDPRLTTANAGERVWLRRERQTLRRLPETGAILFTIRIHRTKLSALAGDPVAAAHLAAAVRSMDPAMQAYKSFPVLRDATLGWLDAVASDV